MKVAMVQGGMVVDVRPNCTVAKIQSRQWDTVMQAYWDAHTLIEVADDSPVTIGDSYNGALFTAGLPRLAAEQEVSERAQLSLLVVQLRDIADGTQTLATLAQVVAAVRFLARFVLFLARAWLRRNL